MKVIDLALSKIKPYPKNPRKHGEAIEKCKESIKQFGFKQPIVVDKKNIIVVGHTRYYASKELDLKKVPVIIADDLTPKQIKAYRIADNRVGEESEWDWDLLKTEIEGLENEFTGFDDDETEQFFNEDDDFGNESEKSENYVEVYNVVISCKDENHQEKIYKEMTKRGLKCQVQSL